MRTEIIRLTVLLGSEFFCSWSNSKTSQRSIPKSFGVSFHLFSLSTGQTDNENQASPSHSSYENATLQVYLCKNSFPPLPFSHWHYYQNVVLGFHSCPDLFKQLYYSSVCTPFAQYFLHGSTSIATGIPVVPNCPNFQVLHTYYKSYFLSPSLFNHPKNTCFIVPVM